MPSGGINSIVAGPELCTELNGMLEVPYVAEQSYEFRVVDVCEYGKREKSIAGGKIPHGPVQRKTLRNSDNSICPEEWTGGKCSSWSSMLRS